MNNEFKNEIFSSFDPNPVRACSLCGKKPSLVRTMLNSHNGRTVRMFKCECGEQPGPRIRSKAASVGGLFHSGTAKALALSIGLRALRSWRTLRSLPGPERARQYGLPPPSPPEIPN